ncbi:MAG: hypothetical protein OEW64_01380 [Gammaproteobacteria bacterium]|nr:hypothetical protein [Gammaproteobacteria bacterium]MDH5302732.1 hypothetical protein [Gammaproteobacteria bacterium]MDH5321336.1 hypothetical protein [Gammaproteobacteria bacterium]
MKTTKSVVLALVFAFVPLAVCAAGPHYEDTESQRIIEAMVAAHGGIERWRAAPSIRFDNIMHDNYHRKENFAWWVAHEVIDQKTRRVWQDWPMDDARIGYDGKEVWSTNWNKGNPSAFMVHFFYYFVNLPWLTQDDGVILSAPQRFRWPGTETDFYEIRMTFEDAPTVGKSGKDFYVLYIDPDSYRLFGYQYGSGYEPLVNLMNMPEGKDVFGPLWRLITRYEEVDHLLFPAAFRTMPGPDERIVGNHVILNIDVSTPFETERSERPEGSTVFAGPLRTN